jgi:hypothetical protein
MNTAGRYIGTDPVGEGGIYMRDTRRRTSGRTRGVLRVRCVGGVAYLRGGRGGRRWENHVGKDLTKTEL